MNARAGAGQAPAAPDQQAIARHKAYVREAVAAGVVGGVTLAALFSPLAAWCLMAGEWLMGAGLFAVGAVLGVCFGEVFAAADYA